ncbi:hypothetical protein DTO166G4_6131 [Paecilomyces variotii]|nr:hypothetical protein DTO164E3_4965 [Paecilomyces variotii]KAJ9201189.1 hypothetical protein DTO032I3_4250 [Paecilomyces variotii]KAJ9212187.1 hypothetical protein DTO166G4_6131 [Paecilomyces variotii]KAJ9224310.1 hypothetical protein DTO169C6_3415 [Paecilomyces variotii]KAJ9228854.1 hypothetical protein DTO166G5_8312 [Paecilomyces variotii]
MATLTPDQIKVLEQTRQRLVHLTHSLGSLVGSLNQSDPLPSWASLQSQASIISNNLVSVSEQLSEHNDLLSSLVAYPAPNYPGRTQSGTLEQLLRTKLDPRVEDWVSRGRSAGASALQDKDGLSEEELAELWEWAPIEANQEARRREWGGNYTLEEKEMGIQNVVTGLRRRLEEEEESGEEGEEEADGDEMEIVGVHKRPGGAGVEFDVAAERNHVQSKAEPNTLPIDEVFRYIMTGAVPKSRQQT